MTLFLANTFIGTAFLGSIKRVLYLKNTLASRRGSQFFPGTSMIKNGPIDISIVLQNGMPKISFKVVYSGLELLCPAWKQSIVGSSPESTSSDTRFHH